MNSVQIHLAMTHVPVILSLVGLIMLIVAFFTKNQTLIKTSYILILLAGVAVIPVFFSGEGSEEAVENIPGISESLIESHESTAKFAMISIAAASITALVAMFASRWQVATRIAKVVVLVFATFSAGLMAQTARLGGQIRHTEIGSTVALQVGSETGTEDSNNQQIEKDDD